LACRYQCALTINLVWAHDDQSSAFTPVQTKLYVFFKLFLPFTLKK